MSTGLIKPLPRPDGCGDLNVEYFPANGCAEFGSVLNGEKCSQLRHWINEQRPLHSGIFYESPEAFQAKGRWSRYAPGPGHNLLEGQDLSFIEQDPKFIDLVQKLVGPGYSIMKKAVIRSTPKAVIPKWIFELVGDVGRPNLNPFVHDDLQDVQYFYCTDYHQDKTRAASHFVTVYVYLDSVGPDYSALRLLLGSHVLGMTSYPHCLRRSNMDKALWYYTDAEGNHVACPEATVTGEAGSISCFHGLTLHGTPVNNSPDPRISIRYLVAPDPDRSDKNNMFDRANERVIGPMDITMNRVDVAEDGSFLPTGSSLGSYE
jgi:hypothetical protein